MDQDAVVDALKARGEFVVRKHGGWVTLSRHRDDRRDLFHVSPEGNLRVGAERTRSQAVSEGYLHELLQEHQQENVLH